VLDSPPIKTTLPLGIPFLIEPESILFKANEPVEIQFDTSPYRDSYSVDAPVL
jgi:hypothetical protein